jgi:hypothetical protein
VRAAKWAAGHRSKERIPLRSREAKMEFGYIVGGLFLLGIFLLPIILSIAAFVRSGSARTSGEEREKLADELSALRIRLAKVEAQLRHASPAPDSGAAPEPARHEAKPAAPSAAAAPPSPAPVAPVMLAAAPQAAPVPAPAAPTPQPSAAMPEEPLPPPLPVAAMPAATPTPAVKPVAPPPPAAATSRPPVRPPVAPPPPAKSFSLEELLGGQVFMKLGIAIFILAMVFFLILEFKKMGPLGKVATGYAGAAVFFAAGFYFEARKKYQALGRSLLAGGWGIAYFVTFALHFIPAARIVQSGDLAVLLLLAVAAGTVGFSLRYRNEWTTAFSFLLIFLSLGLAAFEVEPLFNVTATAIAAAALAGIAWHRRWQFLYALGTCATWVTLAIWIIKRTWDAAPGSGMIPEALLGIGLGGLVLHLPQLIWRDASAVEGDDRDGNNPAQLQGRGAALFINLFGGLGLALYHLEKLDDTWSWVAALVCGAVYVLTAWRLARRGERPLYLTSATVGLGALALVTPLRLGLHSQWVPIYRLVGLEVVLAAGIFLKERWFRILACLGFVFTFVEAVAFHLGEENLAWGSGFHFRILLLSLIIAASVINVVWLRWKGDEFLSDDENPGLAMLFSAAAALFTTVLILLEGSLSGTAPGLAGVALLFAAAAWRWGLADLLLESGAISVVALMAALSRNVDADPANHVAQRLVPLVLVAAAFYAIYALARFGRSKFNALAAGWMKGFAVLHSLLACSLVILLIFREVENPAIAPALAAIAALHLILSTRKNLPELFVEAQFFTLAGLVALADRTWELTGSLYHLPARQVSAMSAAVFVYLGHIILRRFLASRPDVKKSLLAFCGDETLNLITVGYLTLATAIPFTLIKIEALARDKNLLVALLWGLMGLVYLEIARAVRARSWFWHAQLLLAAAAFHLFLVNFTQPGEVGGISLRLLTVVPGFGLLLYNYLTWEGVTEAVGLEAAPSLGRPFWLYALTAVGAALALYEFQRPWVVLAWAALSLGLLLRWRFGGSRHFRYAALVMAVATVVRGIGINLYFRDQLHEFRLNLVLIPAALALLLGGYLLIRLGELRHAREPGSGDLWKLGPASRMILLLCAIILLTGHIWVETSGKILSVWLSLEGLGLVVMGFLVREKLSRLIGLGILCFCIIKLFVHDFLGQELATKALSFGVLGLVLIAVSWSYIRFERRMKGD